MNNVLYRTTLVPANKGPCGEPVVLFVTNEVNGRAIFVSDEVRGTVLLEWLTYGTNDLAIDKGVARAKELLANPPPEWSADSEKPAAPAVEIGSRWIFNDGSPWQLEGRPVEVTEVRDGWVRYQSIGYREPDNRHAKVETFLQLYLRITA